MKKIKVITYLVNEQDDHTSSTTAYSNYLKALQCYYETIKDYKDNADCGTIELEKITEIYSTTTDFEKYQPHTRTTKTIKYKEI